MRCLGHVLSYNCSIAGDLRDMGAKLWGALFANLQPALLKSPLPVRLRFMQQCLRPIGKFKWTRWPYHTAYAARLDGIQSYMVSKMLDMKPARGEASADFFLRRRRESSRIARNSGKWSRDWAKSNRDWQAHIERNHDPGTWSKPLCDWKGHSWLAGRRVASSKADARSRTESRARSGRPCQRWADGVAAAITRL